MSFAVFQRFTGSDVSEWTPSQVASWLSMIKLDAYAAQFIARNVDGVQLLQLDSAEFKVSSLLLCFCDKFMYYLFIYNTTVKLLCFNAINFELCERAEAVKINN